MYRINCYARDNLTTSYDAETPETAIDVATTFAEGHPWGCAHIIKPDVLHGIYIARPGDKAKTTRDERINALRATRFY